MIKLKIKKILSVLLAALLISMVGIPAFAADDTGAGDGETPAASSDYDYTKDERLFNASNPEQYNDGDYQWGGIAPAMYGIIANKMYTVNQINKATAIAEAKKEAEEEVAARKAQEEKEKEKENGKQETAEGDNATYTITFNDNEGSGGPGTQTGKSGVNELSTTYPKRKGYTFIGWDEDKDAVAPAYVLGGVWEIELSADVTLYAIWDDGIPALEDETSAAPKVEGVKVEAFYAFKCPKCGKAVGATSLLSIFNQDEGKCIHCGEYLPDPGTVKVYRFITVASDSNHLKSLKNYDLTKASKDLYGKTAGQYGDGKDLPQSDLIYGKDENDNEILVDFYTSGNHVEFKDSFMAGLFIFLVKFENFATPLAIGFSESAYNDIVWKIRVAIFGGLEKILTLFVSG